MEKLELLRRIESLQQEVAKTELSIQKSESLLESTKKCVSDLKAEAAVLRIRHDDMVRRRGKFLGKQDPDACHRTLSEAFRKLQVETRYYTDLLARCSSDIQLLPQLQHRKGDIELIIAAYSRDNAQFFKKQKVIYGVLR